MKPQLVNEKFKNASAKLKDGLKYQNSALQMRRLRKKLSFVHYPELLIELIDTDKQEIENKFFDQAAQRRKKLGALAIAGTLAVIGSGLWVKNQIHKQPIAKNPSVMTGPSHYATLNSIPTNNTQPLECIGFGKPRIVSVSMPNDQPINYSLLIQAVQNSFEPPSNCSLSELGTLIDSENNSISSGLNPEPNFDSSRILRGPNGNFDIIAPENAYLQN